LESVLLVVATTQNIVLLGVVKAVAFSTTAVCATLRNNDFAWRL